GGGRRPVAPHRSRRRVRRAGRRLCDRRARRRGRDARRPASARARRRRVGARGGRPGSGRAAPDVDRRRRHAGRLRPRADASGRGGSAGAGDRVGRRRLRDPSRRGLPGRRGGGARRLDRARGPRATGGAEARAAGGGMADPQLTPAIVQDAEDGRVLMLAWMDGEALRLTRETGEAWFWSRWRKPLGRKGETSGNTLAVVELRDDCDGDALLLRVRPAGPACHTGSLSCFAPWLWRRVAERAKERPEGSYVARMLDAGTAACARKVGEEGVEAALAGAAESDERLVEELADLWFHSYVLLAARGLDPAAVEDELARRIRP